MDNFSVNIISGDFILCVSRDLVFEDVVEIFVSF